MNEELLRHKCIYPIVKTHQIGCIWLHLSNIFNTGKLSLVLRTENEITYKPIVTVGLTVGLYRIEK